MDILLIVVVLAIIYAIPLGPLVWIGYRGIRALATLPQKRRIFEGIVVSAFIAVLAALLMTRGIGVQGSILAWLAFVALCGMVIWLPRSTPAVQVIAAAVVPSVTLLGAALAIYGIPLWLTGMLGAAMSVGPHQQIAIEPSPTNAMTFVLFVSLVSVPAITASIYARSRLLELAKTAIGMDPDALGRIEKVVRTGISIGAAVAAVFVVL